MGLSARSAELLTTLGLPQRCRGIITAAKLVPIGTRGSRPAAIHPGSLVRVGARGGASFAVDVVSDALWYIALEPPGGQRQQVPVRFVNSGIDVFLECLCRIRPVLERQRDEWAEPDRGGVLDGLRREFESIDAAALADRDSYWSVIFENMTAEPAPPDFPDENSLIRCFGCDNLRSYTPADIQTTGLHGTTARLLTSVGMPRDLEPYVVASSLKEISVFGSAMHALHPEGFVRVGRYGETDIAVDKGAGKVWQVNPDYEEPTFVNSTLRTFLECSCHVWRALHVDAPGLPVPAARGLLERLRQEIRLVDEPAVAHEYTYWSVVLEQLGYELG
jgi:hypothetical protein